MRLRGEGEEGPGADRAGGLRRESGERPAAGGPRWDHPSCGRRPAAGRALVLVDTSVWVAHLRAGLRELIELLRADRVLTDPFVAGSWRVGTCDGVRRCSGLLDRCRGLWRPRTVR